MAFQLTVRRVIKAPRERVFRGGTDPEHIKVWWLPPGWENPVIEVDLRVGCEFRLGMRQPGKEMFYAVGRFTEIRQGRVVAGLAAQEIIRSIALALVLVREDHTLRRLQVQHPAVPARDRG